MDAPARYTAATDSSRGHNQWTFGPEDRAFNRRLSFALSPEGAYVLITVTGVVQFRGVKCLPAIGENNVTEVALVVRQGADISGIAPQRSADNSQTRVSHWHRVSPREPARNVDGG